MEFIPEDIRSCPVFFFFLIAKKGNDLHGLGHVSVPVQVKCAKVDVVMKEYEIVPPKGEVQHRINSLDILNVYPLNSLFLNPDQDKVYLILLNMQNLPSNISRIHTSIVSYLLQ